MNKFFRVVVSILFLCVSSAFADIERVNVSSSGDQANNFSGEHGRHDESVSMDGRFVAFSSRASNLVAGDTNGLSDVFVRDRQASITEWISISVFGGSGQPSISSDGRFVAFSSGAPDLVPDDKNGVITDVFLHDRQTGITELVSFDQSGEQRTYGSNSPTISADGRFITYRTSQIYLYDRITNVTVRVSSSPTGKLGNNTSNSPTISADGRFVAYTSAASNLTPDCTSGGLFVYDRLTGINECTPGVLPSLSANGRFMSFSSENSNLVAEDLNGTLTDIFVLDRQTGIIELISVSSDGQQGNNTVPSSFESTISADGRFVTFDNRSTNLVPGGTDGNTHIFVHDRQSGLTELVSKSANGEHPNFSSSSSTLSADGKYIVFHSSATNLVPGDTNNFPDIFVTENPLATIDNKTITLEKLINNEVRDYQDKAAKLAKGTLYRQSYSVTNNSPNRIYQVKVFEGTNLVCNFFALNPGQSRERCTSYQTVLEGDQYTMVKLSAKVSGSGEVLMSYTDAYYTGLTNVTGELRVTHRINDINADSAGQAPTLSSQQASVSFKIENTGDIELYQVKTYHDPVSPVNSGWDLQCVLGPMKPGQVRHCKRDLTLSESGLNQAMGRVQGRNAIRSATDVVNASNPTYFIVP